MNKPRLTADEYRFYRDVLLAMARQAHEEAADASAWLDLADRGARDQARLDAARAAGPVLADPPADEDYVTPAASRDLDRWFSVEAPC